MKLRPRETQGHAGIRGRTKTQVIWLQSALTDSVHSDGLTIKGFSIDPHHMYLDQAATLRVAINSRHRFIL